MFSVFSTFKVIGILCLQIPRFIHLYYDQLHIDFPFLSLTEGMADAMHHRHPAHTDAVWSPSVFWRMITTLTFMSWTAVVLAGAPRVQFRKRKTFGDLHQESGGCGG